MGLFGTFIGIAIGLGNFQTDDIENGVPRLLEGLKIAFVTSVVGLLFSILLGVIQKLSRPSKPEHTTEKEYLANIYNLLKEEIEKIDKSLKVEMTGIYNSLKEEITSINESLKEEIAGISKSLSEEIAGISKSLSEEIAGINKSLSEEIAGINKLLKDDIANMNKAYIDVIEKINKVITGDLIDALRSIVESFNTKLLEEFGENFKSLDESCLTLVKWQEDHITVLKAAMKELETLSNVTTTSKKALVDTVDEVKSLLSAVHDLTLWHMMHRAEVKGLHVQLTETIKSIRNVDTAAHDLAKTEGDIKVSLDALSRSSQALADSTSSLKELLDKIDVVLRKHLDNDRDRSIQSKREIRKAGRKSYKGKDQTDRNKM